MVSLKDVAQHLNCSPATISLILNNHPLAKNIPAKTKQRVLQAIEELGYVPNAYAKSLRMGSIRTIGILCFDITDPFTTTILRGIEQYLNEQDYYYQLADVQNDPKLLRRFFTRIKGQGIPGVIAMTNSLTLAPEKLTRLIEPGLIFISVGRAIPALAMPTVTLNNDEGIHLALRHLHDLGHRRIAFILGPQKIHDAVERRQSILRTCQELGLQVAPGLMQETEVFPATFENGAQAMREVLERKIPFSAVLAFDDITAYGAIQELARRGLSVPRDVSVVGYDDIWPSRMMTPPLTTLQVPMVEVGMESARLLVSLLGKKAKAAAEPEAGDGAHDIVFKPELVVRGSTAPPA